MPLPRHLAPGVHHRRTPQFLRRIRRHPEQEAAYRAYGPGIHGIDLAPLADALGADVPPSGGFFAQYGPALLTGLGAVLIGAGAVLGLRGSSAAITGG